MIINVLRGALAATATNNSVWPAINGVHVHTIGDKLMIESSNAHVAFRATFQIDSQCVDDGTDIVISRQSLESALNNVPSDSMLVASDGIVILGDVILETLDETFPNLQRIIDRPIGEEAETVGVGLAELEVVARAGFFALRGIGSHMTMAIGDGRNTIKYKTKTPDFDLLILHASACIE